MKKMLTVLGLMLISLTSQSAEFQCNKTAASEAIDFLTKYDDFSGDMMITKMNNLTIIAAYTTYLEAQVEKNPAEKQKLMEQAYNQCGVRD